MPTLLAAALALPFSLFAAEPPPHHQDRPPGPPRSPAEALRTFKVPAGFKVELFAAEPMVQNPVAMAFDDRGRAWVTESFEYPRKSAGPGRDRVRVLEDTDGDGQADKALVFAEGLNIPSGIAIGYGGAFVVNSPDLLFLQDTDGDGKADKREVLVTGFGRDDTHELPSALTWGPDGWLYGLNGVFNPSKIVHEGKTHEFTCAVWRWHPTKRKFDVFCEGTSNPWGLDYDEHGSFFVSACVIDHLWHLTQTGYYHRQGGPYPPYTWKIESIVKHKHQKAAYCGLCWFDSPAFPKECQRTLLMGNVHGNCINHDVCERRGASYFAKPRPDLLSTDDAWFMPVVQKVGPDGALWIADWYDRYHCYQDANRDPAGIDRGKGRIYRVVHDGSAKRLLPGDLAKSGDNELLEMLDDPNVWIRRTARRLLTERDPAKLAEELWKQAQAGSVESLWTLASAPASLPAGRWLELLKHGNPTWRAWAVRTIGEARMREHAGAVRGMSNDPHPDVRLQVAIAAPKLEDWKSATSTLMDILADAHQDESGLTKKIVWQNLAPLLDGRYGEFGNFLTSFPQLDAPAVKEVLPRMLERGLGHPDPSKREVGPLLAQAFENKDRVFAAGMLRTFAVATRQGVAQPGLWQEFLRFHAEPLKAVAEAPDDPRRVPVLALLAEAGGAGLAPAAAALSSKGMGTRDRLLLLEALLAKQPAEHLPRAAAALAETRDENFARGVLSALTRVNDPAAAQAIAAALPKLPAAVKPQALDALASRATWANELVAAVEAGKVDAAAVNANQLQRMVGFGDKELADRVVKKWGAIRAGRNPEREKLFAVYADRLRWKAGAGDAANGAKVYQKVCAQCHQYKGAGVEVGPKLDDNGKAGFDQLLLSVIDPSLVIGSAYQARLVQTADGRSLTGLATEDSPARLVLKVAGGKLETIPKGQIERMKVSDQSMMPEGLEKQMTDREFRDLLTYLLKP